MILLFKMAPAQCRRAVREAVMGLRYGVEGREFRVNESTTCIK